MTAQQKTTNLSVEEALKILKEFSCVQIKTVKSNIESEQLRQALLLVTSLSDRENLGICAKDTQEGFTALLSYLKAFGYDFNFEKTSISEIQGAVYIKFNTQKMSYYIDSYTGSYRGVLVSCQSENDILVGTYGHFPLDLFGH